MYPEEACPARGAPVTDEFVPESRAGGARPVAAPGPEPPSRPQEPSEPHEPSDPAGSRVSGEAAEVESERARLRDAARELEATRERVKREGERAKQAAQAELVAKVFPVLDSVDRSISVGSESSGLLEGVKLVRAQLADVLSDLGVARIDSVGKTFDPRLHEAVDVVSVDSPSAHNRVVKEWEAGYQQGGRVLRPARVRVGRFC